MRGEAGATDTARFAAAVLRDRLQSTCFTADPFTAGGFTADQFTADQFTADQFTADASRADFTAGAFTAGGCEPSVMTHDALSPLLEFDPEMPGWAVQVRHLPFARYSFVFCLFFRGLRTNPHYSWH